jgi:hypothetical protein
MKKHVILVSIKLGFETQLCGRHIAKDKSYLTNQIIFSMWLGKKQKLLQCQIISNVVFDIAVAVAFQSVFCSKIHQNNIYILKFIFDTSTSKRFENTKKLILNKQYFDCDAEHYLNQKHLCNSFFPL